MQFTNYAFIWVISTPTVPYNTPLVWYVHFVFTVYSQLASSYIANELEKTFSTARMYQAFSHGQKNLLEISVH